jgi:DNA processing protein
MSDLAWIALSLCGRIGLKTLRALAAQFGSTQAILEADIKTLCEVRGVGKVTATAIRNVNLVETEKLLAQWQKAGVTVLTPDHYPAALRRVEDAPPILMMRGSLSAMPCAAIVGTREPSTQALAVTRRLSQRLVEQGYAIVSGMAVGIDTQAHQSALALGGITYAVLGSGVLNLYPPENHALAARIAWTGALLSELRPTAPPASPTLVARNRIITGLCEKVFVIETDDDGGAMHAARFARAQGRALYVLDCAASGNRTLLNDGARLLDAELSNFE